MKTQGYDDVNHEIYTISTTFVGSMDHRTFMAEIQYNPSTLPVDVHMINEEEKPKTKVVSLEAKNEMESEIKFGPKPSGKYSTGVPSAVYEYWDRTLQYPDSLEEEICGPIRTGDKGWITVCRYRVKNSSGSLELMQDTFIIKDGKAYK